MKFVLMGNREIGAAELTRWFWIHAVALPVVLAAAVAGVALAARRVRQS